MTKKNKRRRWTANHFSIANPAGPSQDDVPALLRRAAKCLEKYGKVDVADLVFHREVAEDGDWPSITVYFHDRRG